MNISTPSHASPELPVIARIPMRWMPSSVKAAFISSALNTVFARPLEAGELGFLVDRVMNIVVSDAELSFSVRLERDQLRASNEVAEADLTIEGTAYTFMLLAARREDADTLFFRRQLRTSGDTELGLHVKNLLDGLELETLPYHRTIDFIVRRSLSVADNVERFRRRL